MGRDRGIRHDFGMATANRRKRLSDAYRFDGFRPLEEVRGVFGDPIARVVTLVRCSKKRALSDFPHGIGLIIRQG